MAEEKMNKKDTQDLGRLFGWLAKQDKQLYEKLMEEAEARGIKAHELIKEALWFYFVDLQARQAGADMSMMLAALEFWDRVRQMLVDREVQMLLSFFQSFFGLYTDLLNAVASKVEEGKVGRVAERKMDLIEKLFNQVEKIIEQTSVTPFVKQQSKRE